MQRPDDIPRLRGVFHEYAFFASAILGIVLVATAPGGRERLAGAIFAASLTTSFGVSALYHRITWRERARRLMRRLDHAAIYLLIAGTYTPYGLVVLTGAWQAAVLAAVWTGAALAIAFKVVWIDAPKWVAAAFGIGLGWAGIVALPQIYDSVGPWGILLLAIGGLAYTFGAVVYARCRPDPAPTVFGYHELFHVLTIVAAACHFAAIAFFVLPH
jgi:hemolysin III